MGLSSLEDERGVKRQRQEPRPRDAGLLGHVSIGAISHPAFSATWVGHMRFASLPRFTFSSGSQFPV